MPESLLKRLGDYYIGNALSLLNQARTASLYANTTDTGISREKLYADFLTLHLPSKCNVFFGGALFAGFKNRNSTDVVDWKLFYL